MIDIVNGSDFGELIVTSGSIVVEVTLVCELFLHAVCMLVG